MASFCSNDYLGLAGQEGLRESRGAGASRLVSGDRAVHVALERAAAALVEQPEALVFSSGYAANIGMLSALAGPDDVVVSDALVHASLIDGARLSRAQVVVTPHCDVGAVAKALRWRARRRAFVVTESYFSMDADSPDLRELRAVCDEHGAVLVVDEAHALGVLGEGGRGLCAEQGVRADVVTGTFGKAFGAGGAFVAGCPSLVEWLWNRARSFVFSTGLSPIVAACALDGIRQSREEPERRRQVTAAAERMRAGLRDIGADVRGYGHVIPWIVGAASDAVRLSAALESRGVDVRAIRPPTVPAGTARLRVTVTAAHGPEEIDQALEAARAVFSPQRSSGSLKGAAEADAKPGRTSRRVPLVAVVGTGTSVGKTHVCEALVLSWRRLLKGGRVVGIKPVESGVDGGERSDADRLADASSFHVKPSYSFRAPISPHLAARDEGVSISLDRIVALIDEARGQADALVVELPGGLFTPIAEGASNADVVTLLRPDGLLLVAPDRLGVLHDVGAAARAASSASLRIDGVVLVAPEESDASTGRNADEIPMAAGMRVLASLPRASATELSSTDAVEALLAGVLGGSASSWR